MKKFILLCLLAISVFAGSINFEKDLENSKDLEIVSFAKINAKNKKEEILKKYL